MYKRQYQGHDVVYKGNETILVAEDEPMVRSMCARLLYDEGYEVLEAANGEVALRLAQNHADGVIDLLLTDAVMPRLGGIELARHLRASRPGIKVLLTSGYTEEAPIIEHSPFENIPFLQKPFLPTELLRRVRDILDI